MSEEKYDNTNCEFLYTYDDMKNYESECTFPLSKYKDCEKNNCIFKQLQTAKEENEKLIDKINFFEKYTDIEKEFRLKIASTLNCAEGTEPLTIAIEQLTQQNKQMREAIELSLAWIHNHKQCSLDNKCNYGGKELQNLEDILTQQTLKGGE